MHFWGILKCPDVVFCNWFCSSVEYDHVLSLEEQMKLSEAITKEVAIEENAAAYGLRGTAKTNLAHELISEKQEYPTE